MKSKPKRKLSDIDFSREDSHIALVSKQQGGAASGANYKLLVKANRFSEEFLEKMQQVQVTMELPDFLQRFFPLYEDDAKVLAYMMGYVEEADTQADENMEADEEFQDWIKSRMEAFEVIKAASDADNLPEFLSSLEEDDYLALLTDQEQLEKAFEKITKAYKPKVGDMVSWNSSGGRARGKVEHVMTEGTLGVPDTEFAIKATKENPAALIRIYSNGEPTETLVGHKATTLRKVRNVSKESKQAAANAQADDTSPACEVKEEVSTSITNEELEKSMDDQKEMVEKAALESLQKAFEDQKQALEKAQAELASIAEEKRTAVVKSKTAKVEAVVKNDAYRAVMVKAALSLELDDDFSAFVTTLEELNKAAEKSELFTETGASGSTDEAVNKTESKVAKALKAQLKL